MHLGFARFETEHGRRRWIQWRGHLVELRSACVQLTVEGALSRVERTESALADAKRSTHLHRLGGRRRARSWEVGLGRRRIVPGSVQCMPGWGRCNSGGRSTPRALADEVEPAGEQRTPLARRLGELGLRLLRHGSPHVTRDNVNHRAGMRSWPCLHGRVDKVARRPRPAPQSRNLLLCGRCVPRAQPRGLNQDPEDLTLETPSPCSPGSIVPHVLLQFIGRDSSSPLAVGSCLQSVV